MNKELEIKREQQAVVDALCRADYESGLSPKEKRVLTLRYGMDGTFYTLEEVGREFGVTRERVRAIQAKALEKVKNLKKL